MPQTVEELLIKLGVDTSQMSEGLRQAQIKVSETMDHTHKSFLHGTSGAKGFKKALHEIMDMSPALGYALNAAISPVGGAFLAAASGVAFLNKKLDDYHEKLTKIREETIKPITNTALVNAAKQGSREFLSDDAEAFAKRQNDTGGPDKFTSLRKDLIKAGYFVEGSPLDRATLFKIRANLRLRDRRLNELIGADRDALGEGPAGKLQRDKDLLTHYQKLVSEGEAKKAENQEKANDETHGMNQAGVLGSDLAVGLFAYFGIKQPGLTLLKGMAARRSAAETELGLLESHKKRVEQLTQSIHDQERAVTKNKESLKENESALIELGKVTRDVDKIIKDTAPPAPTYMDPKTGGVAYHPLRGAPGYRDPVTGEKFTPGIKYTPIRGAPGYVDPLTVHKANTTEQNSQNLYNLILNAISSGEGIPVRGGKDS